MILKSYEIEKNINSLLDNNLYLLYGENEGLKFDIRDLIKKKISTIEKNTEIISIYEDEIIDNKDYIYKYNVYLNQFVDSFQLTSGVIDLELHE